MENEFPYLRKEKAQELSYLTQKGIRKLDHLMIEEYSNALILPIKGESATTVGLGGVVDEAGNFVELSNCMYMRGKYEVNEIKEEDKTVVYCGYFNYQWGHFLVDVVPRLWYVLESGGRGKVDEYVLIVPMGSECILKGNYMQFMELLGIADKVVIINEPIRYHRVIVPQLSYDYKGFHLYEPEKYYSNQYIRIFDYVVDRALQSYEEDGRCYEKIFLTRSGLKEAERRDCGIEMIDSFFENNGYQILSPEKISLKKLIYCMNHCSNLASIWGTLSHNVLFLRHTANINVIIVERQATLNALQSDINIMKNLNAIYIDANLHIMPIDIGPYIYAYSGCLKRYVSQNGLNPPDYQYTTKKYRNDSVVRYLERYRMPRCSWDWLKEYIGTTCYIQAACNESIQELYPDFQFLSYREGEFTDGQEIRRRLIQYLIDYNVEYYKLEQIDLYKEFTRTIENSLECGKTEFLIYPFGRNGMFFKQVLNERYGIKETAIFDNKLWKYNRWVRPANEITSVYNDKSCFVLTSGNVECRNELLKYCDVDILKGPFAFFPN